MLPNQQLLQQALLLTALALAACAEGDVGVAPAPDPSTAGAYAVASYFAPAPYSGCITNQGGDDLGCTCSSFLVDGRWGSAAARAPSTIRRLVVSPGERRCLEVPERHEIGCRCTRPGGGVVREWSWGAEP